MKLQEALHRMWLFHRTASVIMFDSPWFPRKWVLALDFKNKIVDYYLAPKMQDDCLLRLIHETRIEVRIK